MRKFFTYTVAIIALLVGLGSIVGGIAGISYTYTQAADQNITTPDDARIAGEPVRGPWTMKAQMDVINHHQLERTGGLYYAEMPRSVPVLDENGDPVLDENGDPVTEPNAARASWITATTLTTALGLGIMGYMLGIFAIVVGLVFALFGAFVLVNRRVFLAPA